MNKNSKDLPKIKAPLKNWEEMGLLEFTDGVENDPSTVFEWIRETTEKYKSLLLKEKALEEFIIKIKEETPQKIVYEKEGGER